MPTSRLTIAADERLIRRAEALAAARNTSVSALFSRFLDALDRSEEPAEEIGPLTRRATGLMPSPGDRSVADLMGEALAEKYERDR